MAIQVGAEAPDFELPTNLPLENGRPGRKIKLSDFRGKKNVVLIFYPLDFSPVCTNENTCLRDDSSKIEAGDAQVIGISVDSVWTHTAFARSLDLKYPLAADFHPKGAVASSYGLFHEDKGFTSRATVIVDKQGKVAFVEDHGLGNVRDDAKIVQALQTLA